MLAYYHPTPTPAPAHLTRAGQPPCWRASTLASGSRETPVAPPEEETAAVEADNELPADLVALNGS